MKAIKTKYLPPTDKRGARIKATAEGVKPMTIGYPHELSGTDVHAKAAIALCKRIGWPGKLISGCLPDETGRVFVFAESDSYDIE